MMPKILIEKTNSNKTISNQHKSLRLHAIIDPMKQLTALNILKSGKNVFITGSAGTGKTYLPNLYSLYLKKVHIYPINFIML